LRNGIRKISPSTYLRKTGRNGRGGRNIDSIRGTLTGNRAALERNYLLHLAGTSDQWTLTLLPSEPKIAALVHRVTVSGGRGRVRSIEYLQADGDRSLLTIEPIESR
jgi:hypothetical protein